MNFEMADQREHILHCLLYEFDSGRTAAEAHRNINHVMGQDTISRSTCYNWYEKFRSADRSLQDEARPGRPQTFDEAKLRVLIEADPRLTIRCLAADLKAGIGTVYRHLIAIGKVLKLGCWPCWIPHDLSDFDKSRRSDICLSLLSRRRNFNWLKDIITGDEKWALYCSQPLQASPVGQRRPTARARARAKTRSPREKSDAQCLVGHSRHNIPRISAPQYHCDRHPVH